MACTRNKTAGTKYLSLGTVWFTRPKLTHVIQFYRYDKAQWAMSTTMRGDPETKYLTPSHVFSGLYHRTINTRQPHEHHGYEAYSLKACISAAASRAC